MIKQGSAYWLDYSKNQTKNFTVIELASTQRAISNFVKILTHKEIPVEYITNNGSSYTNGERITISSVISRETIDSVVGLALHEGAHCIHTDFYFLNHNIEEYLKTHNIPPSAKDMVLGLTNFVEDRRIDFIVYKSAPGYKAYYRSMYLRYFYNEHVNVGLKGPEFRSEDWDSYLFRIINIFNKNTDLKALANLEEIYHLIDLENINRLESVKGSINIAIEIYKLIFESVKMPPEQKQEQNARNQEGTQGEGIGKSELKEVFKGQEKFINGELYKHRIAEGKNDIIKAINESKTEVKDIPIENSQGEVCSNVPVHVIKNLSHSLINSEMYGVFSYAPLYTKCVDEGISKGKVLLKKLQIRNETIIQESQRLKKGKLDPRRVFAAGYMDDIFKKINKSSYKPLSLHLSIDGSGSMEGLKWDQTLINVVALGYVSLNMGNIDLTISIRTTGNDPNSGWRNQIPLLILAFDSRKNKLKDLYKLAHCKVVGYTPEGICLNALNEFIPASSYYLDSYLINMSDGMPTFSNGDIKYSNEGAIYDTEQAVSRIKKKGVNIMSYFIGNNMNIEIMNNFRKMYGKDAEFVDMDNINQITRTLNKLFLTQNLIS